VLAAAAADHQHLHVEARKLLSGSELRE
jgi:hypothetical protein